MGEVLEQSTLSCQVPVSGAALVCFWYYQDRAGGEAHDHLPRKPDRVSSTLGDASSKSSGTRLRVGSTRKTRAVNVPLVKEYPKGQCCKGGVEDQRQCDVGPVDAP